jgi:hypothetical protein
MSPLPDDTRLSSKNNNDDNQSTSEECLIPVGVVPIILFLAIVVSALFLEHPRRKIYSAFVAMKNTLLRKSAMTESASQSLLEPYKLTETDLREKTYTEVSRNSYLSLTISYSAKAMPCDGPSKLKVSEENNIVDVDWVLTSLRSGRNNSGYYDFTLRKVPPRKQVRLSIMCKGESESDLQDIKVSISNAIRRRYVNDEQLNHRQSMPYHPKWTLPLSTHLVNQTTSLVPQ